MIVRAAKPDEMAFLQAKLGDRAKDGYQQFDLETAVVLVAEDYDAMLAGMVCLRLRQGPVRAERCWQIEPLILFPQFIRHSPRQSQRKATYMLAKAAEEWIADPWRNTSGVRCFYCFIENKNIRMHGLAEHIGWQPVHGIFYGKEA